MDNKEIINSLFDAFAMGNRRFAEAMIHLLTNELRKPAHQIPPYAQAIRYEFADLIEPLWYDILSGEDLEVVSLVFQAHFTSCSSRIRARLPGRVGPVFPSFSVFMDGGEA